MERRQEIIYLQVRISRLAAEKWNVPLDEMAKRLALAGVPEYIEQNYELLHLEGDETILDDVFAFLAAKGALSCKS